MHKLSQMDGKAYRDYIQGNALIIFLLFIPILALLLKGLYFYKGIYYIDHFIFSLHTQTAFFVFIFVSYILSLGVGNASQLLVFVAFPVYLLLAIKNFYKQQWLATVLNFGVINLAFLFVAAIFLFLVAVVSFLLI